MSAAKTPDVYVRLYRQRLVELEKQREGKKRSKKER